MASKGPRSKLDHESRARRHKTLEAPKEPRHPETHWGHVLEEMFWLSKDFESERRRKLKLAQAKKVEIRASKGMLDQATRGGKREEEEQIKKIGTPTFPRMYSSMLAENLVNSPTLCKSSNLCTIQEQPTIHQKGCDDSDKKSIRITHRKMTSVLLRKMRPSSLKKRGKKNWQHCKVKLIYLLRRYSNAVLHRK
ncbi:UNVERIFIED_CONTAM: protein PHOTOPERIOD-INDEPENDENT EARLY FLOWERING 1, partial [Sesamum radiatum]